MKVNTKFLRVKYFIVHFIVFLFTFNQVFPPFFMFYDCEDYISEGKYNMVFPGIYIDSMFFL